jgi:hypothetical protein
MTDICPICGRGGEIEPAAMTFDDPSEDKDATIPARPAATKTMTDRAGGKAKRQRKDRQGNVRQRNKTANFLPHSPAVHSSADEFFRSGGGLKILLEMRDSDRFESYIEWHGR